MRLSHRYANSMTSDGGSKQRPYSGKRLRAPANALLLTLVLSTTAALRAQQSAQQSVEQAQTGTYSLLYSFQCSPDGQYPEAGLVRDSSGNLYGTTYDGGQYGYGAVFKVTPGGTETVMHSFAGPPLDGAYPKFGSLILDTKGNLYGSALEGEFGNGMVFKVPSTGGETVLYNFVGGHTDGSAPYGGMALDSAGNLYGTTAGGGFYGHGTIFKLTPGGTETLLHDFGLDRGFFYDGQAPYANLLRDSSGNLYGTTYMGGQYGYGTVFKATSGGAESVLYTFKGPPDGGWPFEAESLLRDASGNLYGTTVQGGNSSSCMYRSGCGVVFKLTPGGTESILLDFNGSTGGALPYDGLARDAAGNLYGTTSVAGSAAGCSTFGCGVLFELTTTGSEIVLHNFSLSSSDGAYPQAGVVRDPSGNLYGTLEEGGAYGCGAVFKYTP